ncbi:MAG: O-antigen ligase family protein [bacterium]
MPLKIPLLFRIISTTFIFVAINLFGLYDFYRDGLFLVLNTFDFLLFSINIIFFYVVIKSQKFRIFIKQKPLRYILYIYLFTLLVFISMPFRGSISILDAARVGRHYLILPLAFMVYYDVVLNNKFKYYFKIFRFIALFTSFQIIINAINPEIINFLFKDIGRAEAGVKGDYQRNVLLSPSMIFPHILSIYYFFKIITEKYKSSNLFLFFLLLFAGALQGFRVYFLILVLVLLIITVVFGRIHRKIFKWGLIFLFIIPTTIYLDSNILNNQILGKFYTSYNEIKFGTGSYQVRMYDVSIRQIPMLLEKPLFGWGFIYHNSKYGKQLNIPEENARQYGLYSVDSGYITILMQYGLIGVLLILFWYFKMFVSLYKNRHNNLPIHLTSIGIIVLLVLSLYTHGAFFREFGLVPLTIMIGLTGGRFMSHNNNIT